MIAAFKAKYPEITVNEQQPDANSQEEIDAAKNNAGTDKAPDVFDLGTDVALANTALFAPYQVAALGDIPADLKEPTGLWVNDYAGLHVRSAATRSKVAAPATVADLLKPEYKGKIALNGNPTAASAGLQRRRHGRARQRRLGRRHRARASTSSSSSTTAGNLLPVDPTPGARSPPARRRASSTGSTTTPPRPPTSAGKGIDWKVVVPCDAPPVAAVLHPGHQQGRRRIRRPPACGRSSCTRPRPRTCG